MCCTHSPVTQPLPSYSNSDPVILKPAESLAIQIVGMAMAEAVLDAAAATPWPLSRQQIQDDEGTVVHAQPRCAADGPAKRKR